jgi:DNA-directed RNA polymerase specialized sigma24 family protein
MTQSEFDVLQKHNWAQAFIKLKAYTIALFKLRYKGLTFPKGRTADDLVQEAITSIFDGESTRNWDSAKHPDINKYLMGVISSLMSNLFTSAEMKTTISLSPDTFGTNSPMPFSDSVPELHTKMDLAALIEKIQTDLEDDEIAFFVFGERLDGLPNREIASSLGIEVGDVENAQKRINRIIKKHEQNFRL